MTMLMKTKTVKLICYVFNSTKLEGNFSRWKDLKSTIMVENFRLEKGKAIDLEYRYYIRSKMLSAEQAAMAVREHWGIESMHWVLDVSMNEDACQVYKDHGAENPSCLRHMSLNMLREEPTKLSIVGKQKRCMMNTVMLEAVLSAGFTQAVKNQALMRSLCYLTYQTDKKSLCVTEAH